MTKESVVISWLSALGVILAMFLLGGVNPVTGAMAVAVFIIVMGYSLRLRRLETLDVRLVTMETELNEVKNKLEKIEKFLEE